MRCYEYYFFLTKLYLGHFRYEELIFDINFFSQSKLHIITKNYIPKYKFALKNNIHNSLVNISLHINFVLNKVSFF